MFQREIGNLNKEIITLKSRLDASRVELEAMRQKENNSIVDYLCRFCGKKFCEENKLIDHVRELHVQTANIQTEEVHFCEASIHTEENIDTSEYPCFYCDHGITSFEDLMKHKYDCPVLDRYEDKCDHCDAKFEYTRHEKTLQISAI